MGSESLTAWLAFGGLVLVLLVLDLVVFHRKIHTPTLRESLGWTIFWVAVAGVFNAFLWRWKGGQAGVEFLTGYLIEWSLSMDNVFVFVVIFRFFRVELKYQYRVLFWGILGAIVMRLVFIVVGAELVRRFGWVMPLFGAFLIFTGIRLATHDESDVDPEQNLVLRMARRWFRVTKGFYQQRFFVREAGRLAVTPLFLVLLVIESTDVLFAVDSVPAIFGITKDPFIVFSSNIFAIMGLRALYFLLAGVVDLFKYLNYGLSAVLVFVGCKMVGEYFFAPEHDHLMPAWVSLLVVVSLIGISIVASLLAGGEKKPSEEAASDSAAGQRLAEPGKDQP